MNFSHRLATLVLLTFLLGPRLLWAGPPETTLRTDSLGDSLPPGAMLRLGTSRLRHMEGIYQLAFVPDGRHLASLGNEHVFSLWETATGKETRRLDLPGSGTHAVAPTLYNGMRVHLNFYRRFEAETLAFPAVLSPDGAWLGVMSGDQMRILDTATGQAKGQVTFKEGRTATLAISRDAKTAARFVATPNREAELLVTATADGKLLHKLRVSPAAHVSVLHFSPDGKILAGADNGHNITLWDLTTGKRIRSYHVQEAQATALVFAPDGKKLASSGSNGVRVWNMDSEEETFKLTLPLGSIAVAFSPDGALLATSSTGNSIALWDTTSGESKKEWSAHNAPVTALAFSPDGKRLASGSSDGTLRFWDPQTGKDVSPVPFTLPLSPLSYLHPGAILTHIGPKNDFQHLEGSTGVILKKIAGPSKSLSVAAVSPTGKFLAFADSEDDTPFVRLWNIEENKEGRRLDGHLGRIVSLAFSADGLHLASFGMDKSLRIWDTTTGKEFRRIELPFSMEDQSYLVTRSRNLENYASLASTGLEVAFSRDKRFLICTGPVGFLYVFETATGKERGRVFLGHSYNSRLLLAPDSRMLATVDSSDVVRIWDTVLGKMTQAFVSHDGEIRALAFAPSGKLLAAGSARGTIYLFDLAQGKEKHRFVGHGGAVQNLLFAPDDRTLLSTSRDGTMLFWDMSAPLAAPPTVQSLDESRQTALWTKLQDKDAAEASRAMVELCQRPSAAVKLLERHLKPVPAAPEKHVQQLIVDLGHPNFAVREKASQELIRLDTQITPALQKAIEGKPAVETVQRISKILEKLESLETNPENLRIARAIEVLERIANPDAMALLEVLRTGAPHARLTVAAVEASQRIPRNP